MMIASTELGEHRLSCGSESVRFEHHQAVFFLAIRGMYITLTIRYRSRD